MSTYQYFWDDHLVRYHLAESNSGSAYNWIFFPGGPGADSCYLLNLVHSLKLPGNVWLIDLPGNGSNEVTNYNFDNWLNIFIPIISKFQNPVYVGHSFGGMLPLLYPELEKYLKGL